MFPFERANWPITTAGGLEFGVEGSQLSPHGIDCQSRGRSVTTRADRRVHQGRHCSRPAGEKVPGGRGRTEKPSRKRGVAGRTSLAPVNPTGKAED